MKHVRCALALAVALPLVGSTQSAPSIVQIPERLSCTTCRVRVTREVTLPSGFLAGAVDVMPIAVRRDTQRRIWLFTNGRMAQVYSADGRFIREVGRPGSGPGEFRLPLDALSLPGDSILLLDAGSGRASVFDPSLRFARQIAAPPSLSAPMVSTWPRIIANAIASGPSGSAVSRMVHEFDLSGHDARVTRSFGDRAPRLQPGAPLPDVQVFAWLRSGELATVSHGAYRVRLYSAEGALRRTFMRRPAWFSDTTRRGLGGSTRPPAPSITAIQRASDTTLWVASRVPSPNWRRAWEGMPAGTREVTTAQIDFADLFRTRVDLVNVKAGTVVSSTELDGVVVSALDDQAFAIFRNEGGQPRLVVERMELEVGSRR